MHGPNLAKMAWRNLWRNRRRTLVTLSSIAFGVLLAVVFTGFMDATYPKLINLAARMGSGHVTLQHPEYLDMPSLKRTVRDVDGLSALALEDEDVERVVPRISGTTMLATASKSYGAFFIAIDPRQEDETTLAVMDSVDEGEMFDGPRGKGIILGARLAENLGAKMGRKVVYTLTDKSGEIVSGLARVSGIVRTGAPSVDGGICLLPIDTLREAIGYEKDEVTQVALHIGDQRRSDAVAERLSESLGEGVAANTWRETQPDLAGYITIDGAFGIFFEVIIMVLVAAGIFNTLFVSVMERLREFGILMAIGFSPRRLTSLVMWESLWLGLTGLVAAALVTAGPYYYLATAGLDMTEYVGENTEISGVVLEPVMRAAIYPENAAIIACLALLATLLSGLYPAWRAGRVVPVETIKLV
jgi:ABC-type lipoprotein release transport system permease subunit